MFLASLTGVLFSFVLVNGNGTQTLSQQEFYYSPLHSSWENATYFDLPLTYTGLNILHVNVDNQTIMSIRYYYQNDSLDFYVYSNNTLTNLNINTIIWEFYTSDGFNPSNDDFYTLTYDLLDPNDSSNNTNVLVNGVEGYTYRLDFVLNWYSESMYNEIVNGGYQTGYQTGYTDGYNKGKSDYEDVDSQINSIFEGILSIGLIPIELFMSMFNFSIFGINVAQLVSSILTLTLITILLRLTLKNV